MSLNDSSAGYTETDCFGFFRRTPSGENPSSTYYKITFTTCVITAGMSPMVVAANSVIIAVLWRNPSLKSPSFALLGFLTLTDFCTGLISQPSYVVYKLGQLVANKHMFCNAGIVTEAFAPYLASLTVIIVALMAIERWLHMRRRSLFSVRRVLFLCSSIFLFLALGFAYRQYGLAHGKEFPVLEIVFIAMAGILFAITTFAYYKVFRIVRLHQMEVQTGQTAINVAKYRKSFITILFITLLFLLSYMPYVVCMVVFRILGGGGRSREATFNCSVVIIFASSLLNPLLYFWRIKEIRDDVKNLAMKLVCKT